MSNLQNYVVIAAILCILAFVSLLNYYFTESLQMLNCAGIIEGIQLFGFLINGGSGLSPMNEKYYDLTGSLTYLSIMVYIYSTRSLTFQMFLPMVLTTVWAVRLGTFLFIRVIYSGEDKRFRVIKRSRSRFLMVWVIQGYWVFFTLFSILFSVFSTNSSGDFLNFVNIFGVVIWIVGFAIEVFADYQKFQFKLENKTGFISTGLWSISRHPNYLGEITLWLGISLVCYRFEMGWSSLLLLVSPIFVYSLLNYVSGIPLLEKSSDERFKNDVKYLAYKKNTPILFPFIGETHHD